MSLPRRATADDVLSIVEYLKTKPLGADIADAKAVLGDTALRSTKLYAYEFWRIIEREGNTIKLSPLGRQLARGLKDEAVAFREVISGIRPYKSVLEWAYHQNLQELTINDVAAHWFEYHGSELGTTTEETIKEQAICFFHVCQLANIGEFIAGRRGQTTRLEIYSDELRMIITSEVDSAASSIPPVEYDEEKPVLSEQTENTPQRDVSRDNEKSSLELRSEEREAEPTKTKPIFIGHGKNTEPLKKLTDILQTFQIQHKVTIEEANLGRPISQKVRDTMNECGSAILIFTRDEKFFDEEGKELWRASENVIHELGAASFLYGDRIMIFKEKGLELATNFKNIGYIEFESGSIEATVTDLLKELVGFGIVKITPV